MPWPFHLYHGWSNDIVNHTFQESSNNYSLQLPNISPVLDTPWSIVDVAEVTAIVLAGAFPVVVGPCFSVLQYSAYCGIPDI